VTEGDRQRDDEQENTLEGKDGEEAAHGERVAVALAHRPVAEVLTLGKVATQQVEGQAQTPDRHHREECPVAGTACTDDPA